MSTESCPIPNRLSFESLSKIFRCRLCSMGRFNRKWAWSFAAGYGVVLTYLLLTPIPLWFLGAEGETIEEGVDLTLGDWMQHGLAYGLFAVLMLNAVGPATWRRSFGTLVFVVLYGVGTEWVQGFIPRRTCSGVDALANLAGVLIAAALFFGIRLAVQAFRLRGSETGRAERHGGTGAGECHAPG